MSREISEQESSLHDMFQQPDRVANIAAKIGEANTGIFYDEIREAIAGLSGTTDEVTQKLVVPLPKPVESVIRAWELSLSAYPHLEPSER